MGQIDEGLGTGLAVTPSIQTATLFNSPLSLFPFALGDRSNASVFRALTRATGL
jgi:hypothetical protein